MLHNKRFFEIFGLFATLFVVNDVFAGTSPTNIQSWIPMTEKISASNSDYVLDGCASDTFSSGCTGTWGDEGAIVVNMARKYNDRGGYFCPTAIQAGNSNGTANTWMNFQYTTSSSHACRWICIDGYKGTDCATEDKGDVLGSESMIQLQKGYRYTSGEHGHRIETPISVFAKEENWSNSGKNSYVKVLGIIKYYEHGVSVGPIWIYGTRNGNGQNKSWIYKIHHETGSGNTSVLLCDTGYRVVNGTCAKIKDNPVPPPMCNGWTEEEFNAHASEYVYETVNGCRQYRCADTNKAFSAVGNHTCAPCSTGVRGGPDPTNGVCKSCAVGEFFEKSTGNCKTAKGLSRKDLQYGAGQSQSTDLENQCWTKADPTAYKCCVMKDNQSCGVVQQTKKPLAWFLKNNPVTALLKADTNVLKNENIKVSVQNLPKQ